MAISFKTSQDHKNELDYQVRVSVLLADKKTKSNGYAQITEKSERVYTTGEFPYSGRTEWEFRIPFGQMKKPKVSAYIIEFGFVKAGFFVPIAIESDDADSLEQITGSGAAELTMECYRSRHITERQY